MTKVQSFQLVIRPITDDGLNLNLAVVQGQKYGLEQFDQADVVKAIDLCDRMGETIRDVAGKKIGDENLICPICPASIHRGRNAKSLAKSS
jgi:hypothetical protein